MTTWHSAIGPYKKTDAFKTLLKRVNAAYQAKTVYPPKEKVFRAFELTPLEDVKIVILGQDPYHQPSQANGLAFSVEKDAQVPPSLKNIFKELNQDLNLPMPSVGDLSPWAKEGVLLLNTTLTVEDSKPASHRHFGWEAFTDEVIRALSEHEKPKVFMLWGAHAKAKASRIDASRHRILKAPHPSPLSAHRGFFGCRHFSKANAFLKESGRAPVDFRL
ncbi:MAG: uracil-DNA glycosylase [Candidatus Izemoplasmataceae bacterium]